MDDKARIQPDESLDAMLDRVQRGEQVTILRDGQPVASLVPADRTWDREDALRAMQAILDMSKGTSLGGLRFKDLIHEGHKY